MKRFTIVAMLLLAFLWVGVAFADDDDSGEEKKLSLKDSLAKGDAVVTFRYRFEYVDQEDFDKNANASTLRTTLSYRTKPYANFSLFMEAENVTDIGTEDQYNSTDNGVTDRPVVADPEITEVNQVYLRWKNGGTNVTAGRQEYNLWDQRFVGAVGWRQNHQTFDQFQVINESVEDLFLMYMYIGNVNRIFGDNAPMDSHVFAAKYDLGLGSLSGYGLYLDYDRALALSRSTYGLEWAGSKEFRGDWKLLWEAEYAVQSDASDNPEQVDADYLFLMLGSAWDEVTFKAGYEVLSGSLEDGQFLTPLATLHKFNGWADRFLNTPEAGLEDFYLSFGGKHGDFSWVAVYHDFSAESVSLDYANEFDAEAKYKLPWGQVIALKGAFFSADEFSEDVTKVWVYTTYKF